MAPFSSNKESGLSQAACQVWGRGSRCRLAHVILVVVGEPEIANWQ